MTGDETEASLRNCTKKETLLPYRVGSEGTSVQLPAFINFLLVLKD